ncbi:glycosyltransferase family 4 protein [Vitiosangium sp. GDMCC 1.1324]|uniref:glycosyltransferase family 4 protein n=1 Tax=Vitiosangium sp. (strain GDMCC 1.1324) TaxID=2138576 RepID=UPI000D379680|nr:glycosyltransferase family 4 protein [Vitiosangium sp. GDMCC 1.1324]PTL78274.1 glycosyl transferase family 1 [Vitiosangium sp. GDMCC 1.1324]
MSDLPRLLLCSFDVIPGPSGSSRRVTEYLKALPDRFSVVVLSVKTPDHSHIEKYEGARLLRVPVGSGDLASRIQAFERAVRRQMESEEYALVHFTDPFGGYALCELKGDYGYRLVYEAQGFPSQELRYTHPQLEGDKKFLSKVRRQELFCLMNADLVVTGSDTTKTFIQSLGVAQESVRVVRAPVDLGPYVPDALGVPDGSPMRLMYLGSQVAWQGLTGLLRGLALAVKQVDVRLTLVGARHPDWQPHLEDLVSELGLKQHVEFQPPVSHDDLVKVLTLADVGVLPLDDVDRNRVQGGALAKVSEYLAAGRPVLASDLPVARELVPASAGVFYPPGDAQALAERIIELARDVPRRVALGKQARALAEQWLDAGLIRGQLLDIYDGLLGKRSVPASGSSSESELNPTMMTGTPTNRVLAFEGTVSAGEPESNSPPPGEKPPKAAEAEAVPDTDPGQGGPVSEEPPLVVGRALREEGFDNRLIKTEPDVARPDGPPVVMGLPLRDPPSSSSDHALTEQEARPGGPPVVMGLPLRSPPAAPPPIPPRPSMTTRAVSTESRQAPAPEPAPARPPALPSRPVSRPAEPPVLQPVDDPPRPSRPSLSIPPLPPRARPSSGTRPAAPPVLMPVEAPASPPPPARAPAKTDEPEEISEAEAEEVHEVDSSPTPTDAHPLEEPEEISSEEIHEAETPETPPREPPESRLNPWFAQLAHGYCPPEGTQFARHTPPTTMPGRDDDPVPPPASKAQDASRGKPS